MPIYEYVCKKCGHQQEVLHKVDEKPRLACEECGAKPLSRQVSAAGFRLSGGGWYETDFKSDKKKNLAGEKSETPVKADKADKADNADDTKPKVEASKAEPAKKDKPGKSKKSGTSE